MFGNCTQSVYREEGQSSHNEDNDKRHYSESQRISLQCSGTLGNELLLSQQAGNGNLSDNRQESAKNKYNTTGPVPEISIISQSFKAGTIVSGTRCILIKPAHSSRGIQDCSANRPRFPQSQDDIHIYNLRLL